MVAALIVLSLFLLVAHQLGTRHNIRLARSVLRSVEEFFKPAEASYVPMRPGVGFGFEYSLSGPFPVVRGVLTTLPRYAPLYLPIARAFGRNDLLKLTYTYAEDMAPGVGTLIHETAHKSNWKAIERDDDWREEALTSGGRCFRLFSFNPLVSRRLRELVPRVSSVADLNQISLDSRSRTVTVFLTPRVRSLYDDLNIVNDALFSLTS